jgi:hypothetical protein
VRVEIVKAALQLTPDQEKFWPAIEDAIRTRAKNRQDRLAEVAARFNEMRERTPLELDADGLPYDFRAP